MKRFLGGIVISSLTALASAQPLPAASIHIKYDVSMPVVRESLTAFHDICLKSHNLPAIPLDEKMLDAATTMKSEAYFANGRYARYETGRNVELDKNSCMLVDRGLKSTVKIEDGQYRIEADLAKGKGRRIAMNMASPAGGALAAAMAGAKPVAEQPGAAAAGQKRTSAGQSCTTITSVLPGATSCLWEKLPSYPLGNGHTVNVELIGDMTINGKTHYHAEATELHVDENIPNERFVLPSTVAISGR